jgi:hypothetical protein
MKPRPTGIIRTLPSLEPGNVGKEKYLKSVAALKAGKIEAIYIALQAIPKQEVLHLYLVIEGHISARFNIAGYEPGESMKCWDGKYRAPKYWAICTGPVSEPESPIKMRGFQGFHYTEDLW